LNGWRLIIRIIVPMPDEDYSIRPLVWVVVNLMVMFLSIILTAKVIFAMNDRKERPSVVAEDLIYNFGTSALWVVEVASNTYDIWRFKSRHSKASLVMEWVLALYFVWDSIQHIIKWKLMDEDLRMSLSDGVIGILSYSYLAAVTFLHYRSSLPTRNYRRLQDESSPIDL